MNIYLVSQDVNDDYDTYDAFVVCAKDEADARRVHELEAPDRQWRGSWVNEGEVDKITVKLIGIAAEGIERGEILGSLNAG